MDGTSSHDNLLLGLDRPGLALVLGIRRHKANSRCPLALELNIEHLLASQGVVIRARGLDPVPVPGPGKGAENHGGVDRSRVPVGTRLSRSGINREVDTRNLLECCHLRLCHGISQTVEESRLWLYHSLRPGKLSVGKEAWTLDVSPQ